MSEPAGSPPMLPDGAYEVFVVDAAGDGPTALHLEVTILAGDHKGEVVSVRAEGLDWQVAPDFRLLAFRLDLR